jgi:hypothetical protein
MTKRDLAGRLARWSLTLQEFDFSIFYVSTDHKDWDETLPYVMFAYNATPLVAKQPTGKVTWCSSSNRGRSEKLLHRWLGPYLVVRQTTPVNYEVILRDGRKKVTLFMSLG